jgi:hypothetical protein
MYIHIFSAYYYYYKHYNKGLSYYKDKIAPTVYIY